MEKTNKQYFYTKHKTMTLLIIGIIVGILMGVFGATLYYKQKYQIDESSMSMENTDKKIEVSAKNLHPVIYDNEGLYVSIQKCEYTEKESDLRICLYIENLSEYTVDINFENIEIGGAQFNTMRRKEPYKVGMEVDSYYYISGDDLNSAGATDFDEIYCDLECSSADNENIFTKKLVFNRDSFLMYE